MTVQEEIILSTSTEGLGSVYERVMLSSLLRSFQEKFQFKKVLEYECPFTKGFDNLTMLDLGVQVSVYDSLCDHSTNWQFDRRPDFYWGEERPQEKFELVWNFAVIQIQPQVIIQMIERSSRYVLVFTPNLFNWGAPFHFAYHLVSGVSCHHAESGSRLLRTRWGLRQYLKKFGIMPLLDGYVDIPWWPDTAAGVSEVKENVFRIKKLDKISNERLSPKLDLKEYQQKLQRSSFLERKFRYSFLRPFFAHHHYILGEIQ